ncbi:MAG: putative quinol monooxygenase [Rhodoblastus sp.]
MIYVVATMVVAPDKREQVLAAARIAIAATRAEDGCIGYDLHESVTTPGTCVFVERWRDRAALNAHMGQEHFKAWRKASADGVVSRKIEITSDGKVETL